MIIEFIKSKMSSTEKSAIINMAIRPIGMLISFVYIPVLLKYLGEEKYGVWTTILSILNWIYYFDFGVGNGLRNMLSHEISQKQYSEAKKSTSTAYILLSAFSFSIMIILLLSVYFFDWNKLFSSNIELKPTLYISFAFICINFTLGLSNTLYYSLQVSEIVSIRLCVVQIINLVCTMILGYFARESLIAIALVFGLSSFVIYLISTFSIIYRNPYLIPSFSCFAREKIKQICNIGVKFFFIQFFCLMLFTTDNLIITHYFGPSAVTPFSIVNKLYHIPFSFLSAFLIPYWSRSTIAFENKDTKWLLSSIKKTSFICFLFIVLNVFILGFTRIIFAIWIGKDFPINISLNIIMCVFYSLLSIIAVETQFINGSGKINMQLTVYAIIGFLNIPLSIILGVFCDFGVVGVRAATTILITFASMLFALNLYQLIKMTSMSSHSSNSPSVLLK